MKSHTEVELKFLVPAAARSLVATEMARGSATLERTSLTAQYLDTVDRRLARAGIAWRLRREGRRWIQALKGGGSHALERVEHEVIRPEGSHDVHAHAGTPLGDRLIALVSQAAADGLEFGPRFRTEVRRTTRRVRTRGAVVEIAFDEGRLLSGDATQRIREIEFELVSGSVGAMLTLAERWRRRFGLIYDPRSKAERGDRLAEGSPYPLVRKAARPAYARDATSIEAFGAVLDECLAHVTANSIGLSEGDPALRVEHVHQMRVGIRRLRSALQCFRGWVPAPAPALVHELRQLFGALGSARDSDVLGSGVVAELARVGAPPLVIPHGGPSPDPVELVRASSAQATFLAWLAWRAALAQRDDGPPANVPTDLHATTDVSPRGPEKPPDLHRVAPRRLRRWHRRIVAAWVAFDQLDDGALHELRKRIKRQRYTVEFFAPVLPRKQVERYLGVLATTQDSMGELNDLLVARTRYQQLVASEPAAWFALGWLTARIAQIRTIAKGELGNLAKAEPPHR